ncbi:uncharacterized protein PAC_10640 [Phialocephala subalpina]|uniref:Uncharacterized protein n=1 Tax=Phialocephala subalpina TaxID=576137 RepID=A0A1L7X6T9_9HELO|nr:uncharacterized protein PAC_10640 [Phialocephala subalpina]
MYIPRSEDVQTLAARSVSLMSRALYNNCTYYSNGRRYCRNSAWGRWGRWVLAGILILIAVILVFLFLCLGQRRRRRARNYQTTQTPMTAPSGGYYNNQQQYNPPAGVPPTYGGGYNNEYYGQQTGVAQPQNAGNVDGREGTEGGNCTNIEARGQ